MCDQAKGERSSNGCAIEQRVCGRAKGVRFSKGFAIQQRVCDLAKGMRSSNGNEMMIIIMIVMLVLKLAAGYE